MQQEFPPISTEPSQTNASSHQSSAQYGLRRSDPGVASALSEELSTAALPSSGLVGVHEHASSGSAGPAALKTDQLDEKLRGLKLNAAATRGPGIFNHEDAFMRRPTESTRPPLGPKVVKSAGPSNGIKLTDFPNEVLTQIVSHLHPDSHAAVALVSKRFYALVTTPYAWRTAFLRYFPGQDALDGTKKARGTSPDDEIDRVRSETRYFSRLTPLASWRSEYLLRTRLLRSLARGKPETSAAGRIGTSARSTQKRASAVLTYNSKLPWPISNVHAVFLHGKKSPRVIHGVADHGIATLSDPVVGKIEKWGLDDPFSSAQLEEMVPNMEPYGLGDGPAVVPNVMDVSQLYGMLSGEGFPGGRVYFRATDQVRGRYLGLENSNIDMAPDIPKLPESTEAVCSVWMAKSSVVPSMTQSMAGMMTGSTLGVVTTYALGHDSTGPRYSHGDMTARWVLSPGVPVIALAVDESYNLKRKALGRVWAVALNALGEVYYLTEPPTPPPSRPKAEDALKVAWLAGRTVYWELVESTRRTARPDELDNNHVRGAYSPRSPSNAMNLSREQLVAEAREIEKFLRYKPSHFRQACEGWDMRRKLEVDFANGDEDGLGESIFVVSCGHQQGETAGVCRLTRRLASVSLDEHAEPQPAGESSFGGIAVSAPNSGVCTPRTSRQATTTALSPSTRTPSLGPSLPREAKVEEWQVATMHIKNSQSVEITAAALDMSTFALLAPFEDPLEPGSQACSTNDGSCTPTSKNSTGEIPGRRCRILAIGTGSGAVIAWNTREVGFADTVHPMRRFQTDSPSISCLAVSALYVVHGGSDGLVQAWDPLASTSEAVRTLNAKSSGRVPRAIANTNADVQQANFAAVGGIFLDSDPAVLRGVLTCGMFVRFWTYSSTNQGRGRKRRLRHSDMHGRLASRRECGTVSSYIAAETAELRHEQAQRARELARLRSRFGVGLGDLTEEEAVQYAQMMSEETFLSDEQGRHSASGSASGDSVTSEPSVSGASASTLARVQEETTVDHDDYEAQMQRAIRLSLMEGVNDVGQPPRGQGSGEYEFSVTIKDGSRKKRKGKTPENADSSCSPWPPGASG